MITNTQKIGGYSGSNAPGVLALYVMDRMDVLSVQDPYRHRLPGAAASRLLAGDVVVKTGAMITQFKFPPLTCSFTQVSEVGDGGEVFTMGVSFGIPGAREDVLDFYNVNSQKQWVCLMEDANRKAFVLGNEERGLKMAIGQSVTTTNGLSLSFSAKLNVPAFLLETSEAGLVLANHFPDVEFGLEFSIDFNA